MNSIIDLLPLAAFFIAYKLGDMYTATGTLIISMFALVAYYRIKEQRWHTAHLIGAGVAAVLGGITIALHDPVFIKLKPSIVYLIFAIALIVSHFIGDKVLLQRLPQKAMVMPDATWRKVNMAWAGFFTVCAALNYYVALYFSESIWIKIKVFGFPILMFIFMLAHLPFLSRYVATENSTDK